MRRETTVINAVRALMLAVAPVACLATPVYLPNLTELSKQSNVIVVAKVVDNAVSSSGMRQVTLAVERNVVGAVGWEGRKVGYVYEQWAQSSGPVEGTHGMFFLQCLATCKPSADSRQYVLASAQSDPVDPSLEDSGYRVANELLPILASSSESDDRKGRAALLLATSIKQDNTASRLRHVVLTAATPASRLAAFSVLAGWGDLSLAERVTADVIAAPSVDETILRLVGSGVRRVDGPPPSTLAAFAQWLRSPSPDVRQAAASALRDIGGKEAGYALAKYALDDTDKEVLFFAIAGLIDTFGDDGRFSDMETFEADPKPYVARWKAWRKKHL